MYVVDKDGPATGAQAPRFSPLQMVARALGAFHAPAEAAEAVDRPAFRPLPAEQPIALAPAARAQACDVATPGEAFLAIVNAMLADDDEAVLPPEPTDFDLVELMGWAHDAFSATAEARGVTLALAVEPTAIGAYHGDALRLRQALLNLLSGALNATAEPGLEITAAWDGDALTLQVADAATAAAMARVLTAKRPPRPRRAAAHRLDLARTAARALGGEIRATPAQGVEMILPLRRAAQAPTVARAEAPAFAPPVQTLPGLRILVAEEDAAHRHALAAMLGGMGVEAVLVADRQALLEAWRDQTWDAVLIDVEGDAIFGLAVARSIRAAETLARWSPVPMLALAAHMKRRGHDEALAAGFDGVVAKPVQAASLYETLDGATRLQRPAREQTVAVG